MSNSRKTGISSITGKMVTVRHATESDLVDIEEYLARLHADFDLKNADVVVASEERRIIGFGVLKKENDTGHVSLFEDSTRKGIGSTIIKHLVEYASVKRVYEPRCTSYFTRYGFVRSGKGPSARAIKSENACKTARLSPAACAK